MVVEKIHRIGLAELTTIRLTCQHMVKGKPCGAVTEFALARLKDPESDQTYNCPLCKNSFKAEESGVDLFSSLAKSLGLIGTQTGRYVAEFPIRIEG